MDSISNELYQDLIKKLDKLESLIKTRDRPYLSLNETCDYLQIPKASIYGFIHRGLLPYYKLNGRRVYFDINDLNQFILNSENRYKSKNEIEKEAASRAQNL